MGVWAVKFETPGIVEGIGGRIMLIYIAIILTIHTLVGLYSVITSRIEQKRHRKMILNEIEERNKFFDELEKKLMESEVEEG